MKIETGKGSITLWALIGIWSVSALTSLPGLAISPILGDVSKIFKHATDFDIQMLTSLPSLFIIPFILLAGRLTNQLGYSRLLYWGLGIFFASGLLYFFCETIGELIAVSLLLGVGAGIITPLSTSLITHFFTGEQRTKQFGYSSAINNLSLVAATALAGYLAEIQWRLPFVVYLLPLVSLLLVHNITRAEKANVATPEEQQTAGLRAHSYIKYGALWRLMLYYLLITYLVMIISVNLPFLMQEHGYDSGLAGIVISVFFLFIMLPGLFLNKILAVMRSDVTIVCLLLITLGLSIIFFDDSLAGIIVGVLFCGVGYGVAQPVIYDRTAAVATPDKAAYAMALVMTMNYVAIVICPPIVDYLQELSAVKSARFAFALNSCVGLLAVAALLLTKFLHKKR